MNASNIPLSGLARRLVHDNIVAEEVAKQVQLDIRENGKQFVPHLIEQDLAESLAVAEAAADEFGTPLFELDALNKELIPKELVETKLIQKHHMLPLFRRGNRLFVAVSDPTNQLALDEIKFHTGITTDAVLVDEKQLNVAIEKFIEAREQEAGGNYDDLGDVGLEDLDVSGVEDEDGEDDEDSGIDDTPLVRFVNKMLLDAIRTGASDLHFEPYEKTYRVRFRTDGILHEVTSPPPNLAPKLSARLKVMSRMDITEKRLPQDGRIKMKLSKTRAIDFRVNTLPTLFGEKIVLRILDPESASLGIDMLGFEEDAKEQYLKALYQPQGMMLFTGPTGSGKTVSLYTGLGLLNTAERNISTAEDPVEINMAGINQVHVNPKTGLNFAEALRAFLRQDPDVIMVGEIRDLETGEIAVKAAQTGHMVMSTLHTNSAAETITRMLNMGIAAFNVATSVNLIVCPAPGATTLQ